MLQTPTLPRQHPLPKVMLMALQPWSCPAVAGTCNVGTEAVPAPLSAFLGYSCPGHHLLQPRGYPAKGPSAPQWMARQEHKQSYATIWLELQQKLNRWDFFIFQRKMLWIFVPKSKLRWSFSEISNYEYILILKRKLGCLQMKISSRSH